MSYSLSIDDLKLAEAVARHGSIGAAARELLTTQPSASRRLGAMERRLGITLFERDTTGARATAAGVELARRSARLLADLGSIADEVLSVGATHSLAVGTIQALSPMVFAALEIELAGVSVRPEVDHGPVLLRQVHEGVLDAAIITIANQAVVPRGLQCVALGRSPMVVVLPQGVPGSAGGPRPFTGRTVVYGAIDLAGDVMHKQLSERGAVPRRGATVEAALRLARHLSCPALLPEFAAQWYAAPGDQIVSSPIRSQVVISLVSRPPQPAALVNALPKIIPRLLGN